MIGGLFPLLVLMTGLVLVLQDRLLARQEEQLKPAAERYEMVEQRLTDIVGQMDALKTRNRSIALAMADVRSSSALLGELTQLLPSGMVLDRFQVQGSLCRLMGPCLSGTDCARSMLSFSNLPNPLCSIHKWFNWRKPR